MFLGPMRPGNEVRGLICVQIRVMLRKMVNLNIRIRFKPEKLSVKVDMQYVMKLACMWTSLESYNLLNLLQDG